MSDKVEVSDHHYRSSEAFNSVLEFYEELSRPTMDKLFKKVINSYLPEVMKHPQAIEMHERVLHIQDVQGPRMEGSEKARLVALEHEIFKCQGMVEHGLSANHSMIMDFM
ncbi:40S ribosomal protein S5-1 [Hordeum vulgare]|nr:40S ribosomal protein S5-1 [Hordeum vulgare]